MKSTKETLEDLMAAKPKIKKSTDLVKLTNELTKALTGFKAEIAVGVDEHTQSYQIPQEDKAFPDVLDAIQQAYKTGHLGIMNPETHIAIGRLYKTDENGKKYETPQWAGINISPATREVSITYLSEKQQNKILPILKTVLGKSR